MTKRSKNAAQGTVVPRGTNMLPFKKQSTVYLTSHSPFRTLSNAEEVRINTQIQKETWPTVRPCSCSEADDVAAPSEQTTPVAKVPSLNDLYEVISPSAMVTR